MIYYCSTCGQQHGALIYAENQCAECMCNELAIENGKLRAALTPFAVAYRKTRRFVDPHPEAWLTESDWAAADDAAGGVPK